MVGSCWKPSVLDRSYRLMTVSASARNSLRPHLFGRSITSAHDICNSTVCHVLQSRPQIQECGKLSTRDISLINREGPCKSADPLDRAAKAETGNGSPSGYRSGSIAARNNPVQREPYPKRRKINTISESIMHLECSLPSPPCPRGGPFARTVLGGGSSAARGGAPDGRVRIPRGWLRAPAGPVLTEV